MNAASESTPDDDLVDADAELAEQAAALAERLKSGEPIDLDDCGDDLLTLLPTIQMMSNWSKRASRRTDLHRLGDFRVVRLLGSGGMGVVYEAVQVSLGRRVALKVLRESAALDPRSLRRFQVEAQAAASLRHPHIVPVFATGSHDGIAYYVMEYIECRDLARIIAELRRDESTQSRAGTAAKVAPRRPLLNDGSSFERDVARLARQAAIALEHAHANDVLHRDVKPSNLLIDEKGHLWITDFGLARIKGRSDLTRTGEAPGTPRYMSPEQALGRRNPLDGRTDVYSLGATLYEILTLVPPFRGDDRIDLLHRIAHQDPVPPRRIDSRIPVELETIVLKAMAKVAGDRYATAADMADDLGRFLDDRPIRARRPGVLGRTARWTHRHGKLVAIAGASAVVLAVGLAGAALRYTVWLRRHGDALKAEVTRANRNADLANYHRRLANRHLHAAQLRLASAAIENGQLERAQDILHDQVTDPGGDDPRDFAWHVLWERATREIAPLHGHERNVRVMAVSPDGRTLASGDEVGEIRLWDARTGSAISVLKGHSLSITRLVFSADSSLLASAADTDSHARSEVFLWEAASGRELARIDGPAGCASAMPSFIGDQPALRLHVSGRESAGGEWRKSAQTEVRTYDVSHGPSRLTLRSTWHSNDHTFVTDAGQVVSFTSARLAEADRCTLPAAATGHIEWAFDSARFGTRVLTASTPDGRVIAAAFGPNTVSCREMSTGSELLRYTSESPLRSLALSSDGHTVAAFCESGLVELRSLASGTRVALAIAASSMGNSRLCLAFSPDASKVATTVWGIPGGPTPVTIWDVQTGKRLQEYPGHRDRAAELMFAADGRSLLIAAGPTIRRWFPDGKSAKPPLLGHRGQARAVAFAPHGELLASAGNDDNLEIIKLWDPDSGRLIRSWRGGTGTTAALAFSPDGKTLASAHLATAASIRLWDVATGTRVATLEGHAAGARTLAFHPRGKLLASAGSDKTIHLWEVETQRHIAALDGHDDSIEQLVFGADGSLLASASGDGTVRVWDIVGARALYTLPGPEKFSAVSFSPDGRALAAADEDGSIMLWDAATGSSIGLLRDEMRALRALVFSPDSRILASAGETGPIRLWDVLTAQELHSLPDYSGYVHSLAFAPDGSSLAYCGRDGAVGICRTDLAVTRARRGANESRDPDPGRPSRRDPRAERRHRDG
jgi:eukaryotic-like serine/threonine-protein kinase